MATNSDARLFLKLADLSDEDALEGAAVRSVIWLGLVFVSTLGAILLHLQPGMVRVWDL